jgi:hypothetical protein
MVFPNFSTTAIPATAIIGYCADATFAGPGRSP